MASYLWNQFFLPPSYSSNVHMTTKTKLNDEKGALHERERISVIFSLVAAVIVRHNLWIIWISSMWKFSYNLLKIANAFGTQKEFDKEDEEKRRKINLSSFSRHLRFIIVRKFARFSHGGKVRSGIRVTKIQSSLENRRKSCFIDFDRRHKTVNSITSREIEVYWLLQTRNLINALIKSFTWAQKSFSFDALFSSSSSTMKFIEDVQTWKKFQITLCFMVFYFEEKRTRHFRSIDNILMYL